MAKLTKSISNNLLDCILPPYGKPRLRIPVWDEGQKMFIVDDYVSANGHRYYQGIRFCDNVVIVEKVGFYHNWTYIDSIELYAFNGPHIELIQKRDYEKEFRNEAFIRSESIAMVKDYLRGVSKFQRVNIIPEEIDSRANALIEGCYKSFLDCDYNTRLTQIIPAIEQ